MTNKTKIIISLILITIGIAARLLPHLWNFAPIVAIALFAGVYLGRNYAIVLPVLAMLMGDFIIGFYEWPLMLTIYSSFMIAGIIGIIIRKYKSPGTVIAGSLLSSIIFFLLTNWAVWQFSVWYEKSWSGLLTCYAMALPFFRNTLFGDLFYVGVFFGAYELITYLARQRAYKISLAVK
ncbi:MAG: DUF6580 family putative transport protein [Patescibacteria group bacterium]